MKIYASFRKFDNQEDIFKYIAGKDLWVKVNKIKGAPQVGYYQLISDDPKKGHFFKYIPAAFVEGHDRYGLTFMRFPMNGGRGVYEIYEPVEILTTDEIIAEMTEQGEED